MTYTASVPYKNFKGQPGNKKVEFNLSEREVFRNLAELQFVFGWVENQQATEIKDIPTEDVVEFYTRFENILLEAYGKTSEDGEYFNKGDRYEFEESAVFNACMVMFITDPQETTKLLQGILPEGLEEIVKKAELNNEGADQSGTLAAEVERLRAQLAEKDGGAPPAVTS